jgi:hypothetical protein
MLNELSHVRQAEGERRRRWFQSPDADLIVWYDDHAIYGFQLCYDRKWDEHALTWTPERGFVHNRIDDGDSIDRGYKQTPILAADGALDARRLARRFAAMSALLPREVVAFVLQKLNQYAKGKQAGQPLP